MTNLATGMAHSDILSYNQLEDSESNTQRDKEIKTLTSFKSQVNNGEWKVQCISWKILCSKTLYDQYTEWKNLYLKDLL